MLEHYNKSDYDFILKAKDWMRQVRYKHKIKTTNFLNPNEQKILTSLIPKEEGIEILFDGAFPNSERKRAVIFPDYLIAESMNTNITGFQIIPSNESVTIEHRQILGTIMSLNIDRSLVGDIVILPDKKIYLAICTEFSEFMMENVQKIGREPISLSKTNINKIENLENFEEAEVIIASMRIDVLVAAIINLSRKNVNEYMKQGFVQLNHSIEKDFSHICKIGDLISIKRYGRYKLIAQKKVTKNNKIVLVIGKVI